MNTTRPLRPIAAYTTREIGMILTNGDRQIIGVRRMPAGTLVRVSVVYSNGRCAIQLPGTSFKQEVIFARDVECA